ncbi:MAG: HAD family phosphatase [Marinilabiliales bacterium]
MQNIKNIIFDFGGVIIDIDFSLTWDAFKSIGINNLQEKFAKGKQSLLFDMFERGKLSPEEFRAEVSRYFNVKISDELFDKCWNAMILDIPAERIELLKKLRNNYKLYLLSNSNKIHYDYYRGNLERKYGYKTFSELFDGVYFSFNTGLLKPDKECYLYVLEKEKLNNNETIFIDDSLPNIIGAEEAGIKSIHLQNKAITEINWNKYN